MLRIPISPALRARLLPPDECIVSWGISAEEEAAKFGKSAQFSRDSNNCMCPSCGSFSYLCRGDFSRPAATQWFNAVVGFRPCGSAGIATLECPQCKVYFCIRLNNINVIGYIENCPNWPRERPVGQKPETPTDRWLKEEGLKDPVESVEAMSGV